METLKGYTFNSEFQKRLFATVLRDPTFLRSTTGVVKSEYFTDSYLKALMELVERHYETYRIAPTEVALAQIVRDDFTKRQPKPEIKRSSTISSKRCGPSRCPRCNTSRTRPWRGP